MTPSRKLTLVSLAASVFPLTIIAITVAALLAGHQAPLAETVQPLLQERLAAVLAVAAVACALVYSLAREVAAAYLLTPLRLAEEVGTLVSDSAKRLAAQGPAEFQPLVDAVNRLAERRAALETDVQGQVQEARASLAEEKNRLAALMAELHQSVVVCNLDGRILLYNQQARDELGEGESQLLGLGRSLYPLVDRGLVLHALETIAQRRSRGEAPATASFVTTTRGGRLLRVQLAPVLAGGAVSGYVLLLDDITAAFEREGRQDAAFHELTEGGRGPLGNVRAAAETLLAYPDMGAEERQRFLAVIRDEACNLSRRLDVAAAELTAAQKARWSLEDMLGADLVGAAQKRIRARTGLLTKVEAVDESVWLKVDSFSLLQALTYLARRLEDEYGVKELRLALSREGPHAHLDLIWSGTVVSNETLALWEMEALNSAGETSPLSLRQVVEGCAGEMWFQRERASHRAFFRFLLPAAEPREAVLATRPAPAEDGAARPEFYDFDIFSWSEGGHDLDDQPLTSLVYTVFDTETTGLAPGGGDEIIQIGAVRLVNGRLLRHECYDQLVDPQRPLSPESVRIHGITAAMLAGQPTIGAVLPAFRQFCADTVLVAHNAAFDLRFLQLKEEVTGVHFDRPVLDTLLLSAVLHPQQESHRLEAIAERLGVAVMGRHTGLGDAMVTAEIFLKMIPLLAEQGIHTLGQAREASERTYYARIRY
ncbi:MAG TPA: exonuclease domain-containing protein [Azospira sp.]|nr:exonuclease domain-containing protein [Azospira sp.]